MVKYVMKFGALLMSYSFIEVAAFLLGVDTRLQSIYSIPVRQLTVISLQGGAEVGVLDQVPGQ